LPITTDNNCFLSCELRKCHTEHVLEALAQSHMPYVSVYMYGLKSPAAHLLFLDDVKREAVVELDVEYYV